MLLEAFICASSSQAGHPALPAPERKPAQKPTAKPPSPSICAAEAQSAADKHPAGGSFKPDGNPIAIEQLKDAAAREGERLRAQEEQEKAQEGKDKASERLTTMYDRVCAFLLPPQYSV